MGTIIFDMGGTLYCPTIDHAILKNYYLRKLGITKSGEHSIDEIRTALEEPDVWLTEYMISYNVDSRWEPDFDIWVEYEQRIFDQLGIDSDTTEFVKHQQTSLLEALDHFNLKTRSDCIAVLQELKNRCYNIGMASNRFGDPKPHLERSGIWEFFDVIEYTNVPGYKKPSPFMLLVVANKLEVNPLSCAYIGDNIGVDIPAAQRADMLPILITHCDSETPAEVVDGTLNIQSLSDLLKIFQ